MKVLYIEDNLHDVFLVKYHLTTIFPELKFEHYSSLAKGIEACKKQEFDLVLLDLGLPDSLGVITIKNFRKEIPSVPVIVCSGDSHTYIPDICLKAGAHAFLSKSEVSKDLLESAIVSSLRVYNQSGV